MGIEKNLEECPFDAETRQEQIQKTLDDVPDMSSEELAVFAVKMNFAIANGLMPTLTAQEQASLRTLSQKSIPDAPKQINLTATFKPEQVILRYLDTNQDKLALTEKRVEKQAALEIEQLDNLGDFAQNFKTGDEEDG